MNNYTRRGALALGLGSTALLAGCGSKFISYDGPEVTRVVIQKSSRQLALFNGNTMLEQYKIQLGFTPVGPKQFEGDGKTPEGRYTVDKRNPNSAYFLSVGIDYPNEADRAYAAEMGKEPGGEIFVHGWGDKRRANSGDWTAGCVAVTNREIKVIYASVRDGTPVDIYA